MYFTLVSGVERGDLVAYSLFVHLFIHLLNAYYKGFAEITI